MATKQQESRHRALKIIGKMNAEKKQKEQAEKSESSVNIDDVPQHIKEIIWSMGNSKGGKTAPDRDYIGLVKQAMQQHDCDVYRAMQIVNKAVPLAQQEHIDAANRQPEPENQGSYGAVEIQTYMQKIQRYMIEHRCSRAQATREIDILCPGLREAYIKFINQ